MVVWGIALSLPPIIINFFFITQMAPIMNCTETFITTDSLTDITVLSLVWRTRGPKTKCFSKAAWPASGPLALS